MLAIHRNTSWSFCSIGLTRGVQHHVEPTDMNEHRIAYRMIKVTGEHRALPTFNKTASSVMTGCLAHGNLPARSLSISIKVPPCPSISKLII